MIRPTMTRTAMAALTLSALLLSAGSALAMREILSLSKDELKLKYDVDITSVDKGRVLVVFTLEDDGRLKPIRSVDLEIPGTDKDKDANGGIPPELSIPLAMTPRDGKRVARFELTRELASRAEIWLIGAALDGDAKGLSGAIHRIPLAGFLKPAAGEK